MARPGGAPGPPCVLFARSSWALGDRWVTTTGSQPQALPALSCSRLRPLSPVREAPGIPGQQGCQGPLSCQHLQVSPMPAVLKDRGDAGLAGCGRMWGTHGNQGAAALHARDPGECSVGCPRHCRVLDSVHANSVPCDSHLCPQTLPSPMWPMKETRVSACVCIPRDLSQQRLDTGSPAGR